MNIKQQVMAGVAVLYVARKLSSVRAFKIYTFAASFGGLAVLISLRHVLENFTEALHGGAGKAAHFFLTAVLQTQIGVQLVLCVAVLALASLAIERMPKVGTLSLR